MSDAKEAGLKRPLEQDATELEEDGSEAKRIKADEGGSIKPGDATSADKTSEDTSAKQDESGPQAELSAQQEDGKGLTEAAETTEESVVADVTEENSNGGKDCKQAEEKAGDSLTTETEKNGGSAETVVEKEGDSTESTDGKVEKGGELADTVSGNVEDVGESKETESEEANDKEMSETESEKAKDAGPMETENDKMEKDGESTEKESEKVKKDGEPMETDSSEVTSATEEKTAESKEESHKEVLKSKEEAKDQVGEEKENKIEGDGSSQVENVEELKPRSGDQAKPEVTDSSKPKISSESPAVNTKEAEETGKSEGGKCLDEKIKKEGSDVGAPPAENGVSRRGDTDIVLKEELCEAKKVLVNGSSVKDEVAEDTEVKSESSEKENYDKDKSISPDVIMLSDEEDDAKNKDGLGEHRSKVLKKIKELQNQLRNEEATLVLLKKLRQSQTTPVQEPMPQVSAPKPPSQHLPQQNPAHMRQHGGPPPLVRGGQPGPKTLHSSSPNVQMRGQPLNNQSRSQQGPPPLVMTPRSSSNGQIPQSQQHGSRSGMLQNMSRSGGNNRSQQQMQQQQPQPPQVQKAPPAPAPPPQDTQTPAQRQAAAKQALRKQLEKTLLQIPPPKPPPPEMNFIPSLACPDFILLLGLEEVVNHMIDFQLIARGQKNPDERFVCTPFTCVQCGSDFTPVWKREKPGSKNVICEHCVTSNQKKALKQEHTNRLKSAFVKALQQEQEIERMQATSTPVPSPQPTTSSTPQPREHSASASALSAASAAAAAANAAAAAAVAKFRPSAEQLRQRHNYLQQAQQAQLRAGQPLGLQAFSHHAPFPYNLPFANQQELQRQYLLDMIPRGNMSWKQ